MLDVCLPYLGTFHFTGCSGFYLFIYFCKCRYLLVRIPGVFSPPSYSVGKDAEVYTHHNMLVSLLP